ncbi:MAG: lamin tail domain-containing protein, partial [Chloroflexota bacterium]|nr:lamin tail domain-containing protein [Chloroflexota bacterium]
VSAYDYLIYANHEDDVRDSSGTNIVDIWDATIGMNNSSPGQLILYDAPDCGGNMIDTVNQSTGDWFAGDPDSKRTMERKNPTVLGTDAANWGTNDGVTRNGQDANSDPLNGTPKLRNSASATEAELIASKQGPAQIYGGAELTYTLRLRNLGNITATNTYLTDTLPAGVALLASSRPTSTQNGSQVVWQLGNLASGAEQVITLTTVVSEQLTGAIVNQLTARSAATETLTANNSTAWTTTVLAAQANLRVSKRGPAEAIGGDVLTYYLTLANDGMITATDVWLTDTLPAGLIFSSSDPAPTTHAGQQLIWQLGALNAGSTQELTVTAQSAESATGEAVNHLTATTTGDESSQLDNRAVWTTTLGAPPTARVLINAVLYDGYQDSDADEAIQLLNAGDTAADLTGWELCKYTNGYSCRALPLSSLAPHERVWLARNTVAFSTSFGFPPDYELASWLSSGLSNAGDEVILRDETQTVVDAVVFEGGTAAIPGWSGESVQPYTVGRAEGQILSRIPDETTGRPISDTDTASDWIQNTGNPAHGRRVLYPGWDLDPLFQPLTATETATVVVGIAPDNAFDVISATLLRAQHTISIETYSLRHPAIITALVAKAQAGVNVTVLLEGSQVGVGELDPRWQQELWACQQLEAAGGRCYFMIHDSSNHIFNRYNYLHAKLLIVDDAWVAVSSQNFTNSSMPADDKSNGTYGSRGTVIAATAPSVVARATEIFALDCDAAHHNDILRWNTGSDSKYGPPSPGFTPNLTIPDGITNTVYFSQPLVVSGTFGFELFTAPEAALRQTDALLGLLARGGDGDRVSVEQLYEHADWGDNPTSDPNLRLEAYIAAARRGAEVRILVNNGTFGQEYGDRSYTATLSYVNQIASVEGLNLRAAAGDPTNYGIHNKLVLVWLADAGGYAHVGSINGSESSSKVNREVALQVHSDAVYEYLERMFMMDWWLSNPIYLPLVMRRYKAPDQLFLTEVFYNSDRDGEWVELYNPMGQPVDLSVYKIGDAEQPEGFEGMYRFPDGAVIAPGQVIVVAYNGTDVPEADYEMYDFSGAIPNMVRYPNWGDPNYDWGLRNAGDQVLLLGPTDQPVDVVVWGDAAYPGVIPHPGVVVWSNSLQRFPPAVDTDDCNVDFREFAVTPGKVIYP